MFFWLAGEAFWWHVFNRLCLAVGTRNYLRNATDLQNGSTKRLHNTDFTRKTDLQNRFTKTDLQKGFTKQIFRNGFTKRIYNMIFDAARRKPSVYVCVPEADFCGKNPKTWIEIGCAVPHVET